MCVMYSYGFSSWIVLNFTQKHQLVVKFTDEQYTTNNHSRAGGFDPRVFVNCLQVEQLTKSLGSKCPALD